MTKPKYHSQSDAITVHKPIQDMLRSESAHVAASEEYPYPKRWYGGIELLITCNDNRSSSIFWPCRLKFIQVNIHRLEEPK